MRTRYETNLLNTAAQAMDFIHSDVHHPNVFVHLDSYHMHTEESGIEAAVRTCGDRLGYVHIGESHRCV
jgi:D-psicose/D-tagatose/L-ribulose 3-epimerase